jgi:hypothetical protein
MRHAKDGKFYETAPHRSLANNSVAYTEKPDLETFMDEWLSLYRSKSGERGIFNRAAADYQAGVRQDMSGGLTHALKSSLDRTNSVTYRKLLFGLMMTYAVSNARSGLLRSWELSRVH